ncbi:MAG: HAD family phosphatase [Dehalococcoidia bacterium]|nr:HAD family phosphatase [Dehalococcoidia bacterium]
MRHMVLASDFDETLATRGRVLPETLDAVVRLKESGRRFVLVTGRILEDLENVFPELSICDRVVAENGAVVFDPGSGNVRTIAPQPPKEFAIQLAVKGVDPLDVGRVIVATVEPHQDTVLATIQELGLELQIIFNKGSVMVLPAGSNKGVGLQAVIDELGVERTQVAAIGDAENDHSLFETAGFPVAVANALESLKAKAAMVTTQVSGAGVRELIDHLLSADIAETPLGQVVERASPVYRG